MTAAQRRESRQIAAFKLQIIAAEHNNSQLHHIKRWGKRKDLNAEEIPPRKLRREPLIFS